MANAVHTEAPLLEARGIYKYFGAITALNNVSFHVDRGEVLGVVGDNRAGKSTLMKILSGLYEPSEGELVFQGSPVRFASPKEARHLGIEMVYQDFALAGNMAIYENIYLGREPARTTQAPKKMAALGIQTLVDMKAGKTVAKSTDPGTVLVTKENAAQYT